MTDNPGAETYPPRRITLTEDEIYQWNNRRRRATQHQMQLRAQFLLAYADEHGPVTVRQLYYQAEVMKLTGIDKTESSYGKIQRQVLKLRREGHMNYSDIADLTRFIRKVATYASPKQALQYAARWYRKDLWHHADCHVEIWIEKNALAAVIEPITGKYGLGLAPTVGFASETFCFAAVDDRDDDTRPYHVYYLGDFDRAGQDAAKSLEEKLRRFAGEKDIPVYFESIAVNQQQIEDLGLSTRAPKRESAADRAWPYEFACELDAMTPDYLRGLVEAAIQLHMSPEQFAQLKLIEAGEKLRIRDMVELLIDDTSP